jgi:copper chaperone CopZ
MLPVFGQAPPEPETTHEETGACSDDCCSESTADTPPLAPLTPRTREENPQAHEGTISRGGLARTVVRVEGRDCRRGVRLARGARHRRGRRLPRHPGQARLRGFGDSQARDRAGQAVAEAELPASCAATVEKRVGRLPGMHRAVVNFAAGRLDAEHERGLELQEIEKAVRDAGYGVGSAQEVERTPEPSIAA